MESNDYPQLTTTDTPVKGAAPITTTTAGISHVLPIRTPYYTADVPVWLDEAADPATWARDFMTEEAREVVRAVGAWVVVFRRGTLAQDGDGDNGREGDKGTDGDESERLKTRTRTGTGNTAIPPQSAQPEPHITHRHTHPPPWRRQHALSLLASIAGIIAHAHSSASEPWDGVLLAVGMPGGLISSSSTSTSAIAEEAALADEWEDACFEAGFEYVDCGGAGGGSGSGRVADGIDYEKGQRNEFGEVSGVARVRQALEACEWEDMELAMGEDDNESNGNQADEREGDVDDDDDLAWLDDDVDFTSFSRAEVLGTSAAPGVTSKVRTGAGAALLQPEEAGSAKGDRGIGSRKEQGQAAEEPESESEQDVEHLDVLLRKVLAVKEMSGHLSESERKRMARRLVGEVMGGDGSSQHET